jgi:methylmalonyl-CoA mutase cobalamin-binding subunit
MKQKTASRSVKILVAKLGLDGHDRDVLIVGGGVIPDIDHKDLIKAGVDHVYGPGTTLPTIVEHINTGVSKLRKI